MENNNATTYTPAKKRTGCREPTGVTDLVFIHTDLAFFNRVGGGLLSITEIAIDRNKIIG